MPASLNRYNYVQGDPIHQIDPDGEFLWVAAAAVAGCAAGGVSAAIDDANVLAAKQAGGPGLAGWNAAFKAAATDGDVWKGCAKGAISGAVAVLAAPAVGAIGLSGNLAAASSIVLKSTVDLGLDWLDSSTSFGATDNRDAFNLKKAIVNDFVLNNIFDFAQSETAGKLASKTCGKLGLCKLIFNEQVLHSFSQAQYFAPTNTGSLLVSASRSIANKVAEKAFRSVVNKVFHLVAPHSAEKYEEVRE